MVGSRDSRVGAVRSLVPYAWNEVYFGMYNGLSFYWLLFAAILGMLLDHPVLQLFGWMLGTLFICIGLAYGDPAAFVFLHIPGNGSGKWPRRGGYEVVQISFLYLLLHETIVRLPFLVVSLEKDSGHFIDWKIVRRKSNRPSRGTLVRRKQTVLTTEPNV